MYALLEESFEMQRKTIEDVAAKQSKPLQTLKVDQELQSIGDLFSKDFLHKVFFS